MRNIKFGSNITYCDVYHIYEIHMCVCMCPDYLDYYIHLK